MKHPSNRELFDYWNERRGERLEVRTQRFQLRRRQRRQQTIGMPCRRHRALRVHRRERTRRSAPDASKCLSGNNLNSLNQL